LENNGKWKTQNTLPPVTSPGAFLQRWLSDKVSGRGALSVRASPCYKFLMPKITEQWLLFKYVGGEFTALSKLKTKERAEKERLKYPEKRAQGD